MQVRFASVSEDEIEYDKDRGGGGGGGGGGGVGQACREIGSQSFERIDAQ